MHTKNVLPDRWIVVVRLLHGPGLGKISVCSFVINSIAFKYLAKATSFLFLLGFGSYICYKAYHCLHNLAAKPNIDEDDDISCVDPSDCGWQCYISSPNSMVKCHNSLASAFDQSLSFSVLCQSPCSVIQRSQFPEIYASYISNCSSSNNSIVFEPFFEDNILWPYSDDSSEEEIYANNVNNWKNIAENDLCELSYSSFLPRDDSIDNLESLPVLQSSSISPSQSFASNEVTNSVNDTEPASCHSDEPNVQFSCDISYQNLLFSDTELHEIKQLFPGDSNISFFDKVCKEIAMVYNIPGFRVADIHRKVGSITASELSDIENNVHKLKQDISGIVSDLVNLKLCCCTKELSWRLFYTSDCELSDTSQNETIPSSLLDVVQNHRAKIWFKGLVQSPTADSEPPQPDVLPELDEICSSPASSSRMSYSSSLSSLNENSHLSKCSRMKRSFSFQSNRDLDQNSRKFKNSRKAIQNWSPNCSLSSSISHSHGQTLSSGIKQSRSSYSIMTSLKQNATRLPRTASSPEGGLLTKQILCAIKNNKPSVPSIQRSITLPSFDHHTQVNSLSISSGLYVSQESFEGSNDSESYLQTFMSSSSSFESNFDRTPASELCFESCDKSVHSTLPTTPNRENDWDCNDNVYEKSDFINANVENSMQSRRNSIYSDSVFKLQEMGRFLSEGSTSNSNLYQYKQIEEVHYDAFAVIRAVVFQILICRLPILGPYGGAACFYEKYKFWVRNQHSWLQQWRFNSSTSDENNDVLETFHRCILTLDSLEKCVMNSSQPLYLLKEILNSSVDEEVIEAVKLVMVASAIELYEQYENHQTIPMFAVLLFNRLTTKNAKEFLLNHLNLVGRGKCLEQIDLYLLGYSLSVTITVIHPNRNSENRICSYPEHNIGVWPEVILVSESCHHYSIVIE